MKWTKSIALILLILSFWLINDLSRESYSIAKQFCWANSNKITTSGTIEFLHGGALRALSHYTLTSLLFEGEQIQFQPNPALGYVLIGTSILLHLLILIGAGFLVRSIYHDVKRSKSAVPNAAPAFNSLLIRILIIGIIAIMALYGLNHTPVIPKEAKSKETPSAPGPEREPAPVPAQEPLPESIQKFQKYYFVEDSTNQCGCPRPKTGSENSSIAVSNCDAYVKKATDFLKIGSMIQSCESFTLKNANDKILRHILFYFGAGQDCPSGCFYQTKSVIFDESKSEVVFTFPFETYGLFSYLKTGQFNSTEPDNYIKYIPKVWLRKNNPALTRDASATTKMFCKPYLNKVPTVYLLHREDQYNWATDLEKEAACSVKYWSGNGGGNGQIGFKFTGTMVELLLPRRVVNVDFSLLKIDIENGQDYSVNPADLEKSLNAGKYKLIPLYFNPRENYDPGPVKIVDESGNTIHSFSDFTFYREKTLADTKSGLYWIDRPSSRDSTIKKLDYSTREIKTIITGYIGEFLVSPNESYVLYGNGKLNIYQISSGKNLAAIPTDSESSKVKWLDDQTFSFQDWTQRPLIDYQQVTWKALENEAELCRTYLSKSIQQGLGSKKFKLSFYADVNELEDVKKLLESEQAKVEYAASEHTISFSSKDQASAKNVEASLRQCPFLRNIQLKDQ